MSRPQPEAVVLALALLVIDLGPGCTAPLARVPGSRLTLADNPSLPGAQIARLLPPGQWRRLRELDYLAYVIMDAGIRPDGSVQLGRITARFPDAAWDALATSFAQDVVLRASSLGSRLEPRAEISVIFYKPVLDGRMVLIFGRQLDVPDPGNGDQRAMYLFTAHYDAPPAGTEP